MSRVENVLIIGSPANYTDVDDVMLKEYEITPFYIYIEDSELRSSNKNNKLFISMLTEEVIREVVVAYKLDSIVCFNDLFLLKVAKIRQELNLKGIHFEQMKKFKKKSIMYNSLKKYVQVIPHVFLSENTTFENMLPSLGLPPYFAKPDDSAGSEGAVKIDNENEYIKFLDRWKSDSRKYIIQPFIEADLYHCELVVKDNVIIYKDARKYSYPNYNILSGKVIASFPIVDNSLKELIVNQACLVQEKLGFSNGLMHTEFFVVDENNIKFLETNIRQAGGAINQIHYKKLGISLETLMILLECEKEINITPSSKKIFSCGYIPRKKGKVIGFNFPKFKGIVEFQKKIKIGDICDAPKSASDAALAFVGEYELLSELQDDFKMIESYELVTYSENKDKSMRS